MANANFARGLIPYRHFDGSVWNGSANIYFVPASYGTNLFIGDPVDIISGSNDAFGLPAVQLATSGSPMVGSVIGIAPGGTGSSYTTPVTRDLPIYRQASVAQYILVADDPTLLFWVQDNGGTAGSGGTSAANWAGKNANLVSGSGSTVTGYSGWQLQGTSVNTTATLDVKIMRPLDETDNTVSTTSTGSNTKWLVKLNNYRFAVQVAGV